MVMEIKTRGGREVRSCDMAVFGNRSVQCIRDDSMVARDPVKFVDSISGSLLNVAVDSGEKLAATDIKQTASGWLEIQFGGETRRTATARDIRFVKSVRVCAGCGIHDTHAEWEGGKCKECEDDD